MRVAILALTAATLWAQMPQLPIKKSKEEKEPETQTLQLPKELPAVVAGDTRKLTFYVSPLTSKGLLSQQIREAIKAIDRRSGSDTILKIRAFVAGTGDVRRVRELVSEIFSERRQPLPALTLVRCGGLPMEGAQVVLEAIASGRKDVNPEKTLLPRRDRWRRSRWRI